MIKYNAGAANYNPGFKPAVRAVNSITSGGNRHLARIAVRIPEREFGTSAYVDIFFEFDRVGIRLRALVPHQLPTGPPLETVLHFSFANDQNKQGKSLIDLHYPARVKSPLLN